MAGRMPFVSAKRPDR